jgi:hypothetical protein
MSATANQIFDYTGGRIPDQSWFNFSGQPQPLRPGINSFFLFPVTNNR